MVNASEIFGYKVVEEKQNIEQNWLASEDSEG
jgi:hypothetical protein